MRKNLKEARLAAGLLQKELADSIYITHQHYNNIENGRKNASALVWDLLAQTLGRDVDTLRENV